MYCTNATYRNKRIYSTVLCENAPQLIIQVLFCVETKMITNITVYSFILSSISIVLSIFEYISSRMILDLQSVLVIKLEIESDTIALLSMKHFRKLMSYRLAICGELAKIIEYDPPLIELLKPLQTAKGVNLIFHIRCNSQETDSHSILEKINNSIKNGQLIQRLCRIWHEYINDELKIETNISMTDNNVNIPKIEAKIISPMKKSKGTIAVISIKSIRESLSGTKSYRSGVNPAFKVPLLDIEQGAKNKSSNIAIGSADHGYDEHPIGKMTMSQTEGGREVSETQGEGQQNFATTIINQMSEEFTQSSESCGIGTTGTVKDINDTRFGVTSANTKPGTS